MSQIQKCLKCRRGVGSTLIRTLSQIFPFFFLVTPPLRKLLLVDTNRVDIHIIYIWCRLSLKCITSFHLHYANAFNFNLEHIDFIMCVNPWTLQVCAPGDLAGARTWRPCRCAHLETLQVRAPGDPAGAHTWMSIYTENWNQMFLILVPKRSKLSKIILLLLFWQYLSHFKYLANHQLVSRKFCS